MARSINDIKQDLLAKIQADAVLGSQLTSTSNVAIFNLLAYTFAVCSWAVENLFDLFTFDVNNIIAQDKPHTPQWYINKAKAFQYGYNLVPNADYYDNTNLADDVVAASKIVAYAALTEEPFIRMKVAKLIGGNLAPLATAELAAFVTYIRKIRDCGVRLNAQTITSTAADNLRLVLRVIYNPMVLNSVGGRNDGTAATPVKDAVKGYLQNLSFNGTFSTQKLVDAIQAIDGVEDLSVDQIQTKYGLLNYTSVDIDFVPDSGYLVIDDVDLVVEYLAG